MAQLGTDKHELGELFSTVWCLYTEVKTVEELFYEDKKEYLIFIKQLEDCHDDKACGLYLVRNTG